MTSAAIFLVVAAFLASAVEMVEALTIVLAVGVTRGWRSTLFGVGSALVILAILIAIFGPLLTLIPIGVLQVIVGAVLLIFGLQWLRKAILRASGYKALHDEDAIYKKELAAAQAAGTMVKAGMDWYSYTIAFKGVLLEGLEVAFIVITFGSTAQRAAINPVGNGIALAAAGAAAAVIIVGVAGVAIHAPLARVPENVLKYAVGALLTTFGTFWSAEGVGVQWPAADGAIIGILVFVLLCSFGTVAILRQRRAAPMPVAAGSH